MTTIANSLGIGSGIDTAALITSLTAAARDPKNAAITARETANTAKISALASTTSAIDNFASSLGSLISGGTLFTQPTSSDSDTVTASALPGARLQGFSASLQVNKLAVGQTNVSARIASASTAIGQGTLNLNVGGRTLVVSVTSANDSLNGLAAAINAKKAGVTASVVTDTTGARLVLKGQTGAANGFSLTKSSGDDADIGRFVTDADGTGGMSQTQAAGDAELELDGIAVTRPSNSISDLVDGVQLTLVKTSTTAVTLGTTPPTTAIKAAVTDFVSAYNSLESLLDEATATSSDGTPSGALAGEASIRTMRRTLAALASTPLASGGTGPKTLAEIGVKTQRDGSLKLDTNLLDARLAADPAGVEALFNPSQTSDSGLVTVTSAYGKAKPGTYLLTDLVPASGGTAASGTIAGKAATGDGDGLTAATSSAAAGLVVKVSGAVASAKITIDLGLGGALQAIRDSLRGDKGALTSASNRFTAETKSLAAERGKLDTRIAAYKAQLETSFTAMESRMALLKATQTQLTNQIAQWNKSS